jgi:DNA-binding IclR family transcriptional regulator
MKSGSEDTMEGENTNYALNLFKVLRAKAGRGGKVQMEMNELCRVVGLSEEDARECLSDLQCEGFITTEIICYINEEWR